jgi:hypothetical protein
MNGCEPTPEAICPCGLFVHPRVISNPPGLDAISYRVGDYTTFRHALLLARPGETELSRVETGTGQAAGKTVQIWRPSAEGDLAVQMVEWWAYVADVLTFYNERVASSAYLRTAELPSSVNRLIRLLGYRPRPGIGATGMLAAVSNRPAAFTLPQGFQVQSKPGPGEQPQVFESLTAVQVGALATGTPTAAQGVLAAAAAPAAESLTLTPDSNGDVTVYLQGASSAMEAGDEILFLPVKQLSDSEPAYFVGAVSSVTQQKDVNNKPITSIVFTPYSSVSAVTDLRNYQLLTSNQSVQVWQYPAATLDVIRPGLPAKSVRVDLNSIVRAIKVGDDIVFDSDDPAIQGGPKWGMVSASTEAIWYANPKNYDPSNPGATNVDPSIPPPAPNPSASPPTAGTVAIPILHTSITFDWSTAAPSDTTATRATYLVRYGWKAVGPLIPGPVTQLGGTSDSGSSGSPLALQPSAGATLPSVTAVTPVLIEDAIGNGANGTLDTAGNLQIATPVPTLYPPLNVLFNVLPVTRGKTVANEVLGSGNASLAGQDFTLQKTPVTYLQDPASKSGDDYSSTVQVWVNGVQWSEVTSFYGQPANAQVFVTSEDEEGNTHVTFGDGEYGARVPTGVNNVIATYRYGSGAAVPDAGSLTVVLQPQPGLQAILNPVPAGGGSDPDPASKIVQLAPQSVLTFHRAISADDFQVIASQAPGVTRASAVYSFDAVEQRPRVKVWVGDNQGAVNAAQKAIAAAADPNRLPRVALATPIEIYISLTLVTDPRYQTATVQAAVHGALLDPDTGLFGVNAVGIGQIFYDSQVFAACLSVAGVQAVHNYDFISGYKRFRPEIFFPGKLRILAPAASGCQCNQSHVPTEGGYFFLPDDGAHLILCA